MGREVFFKSTTRGYKVKYGLPGRGPCLEIDKASKELHDFFLSLVGCQYMEDEKYYISRGAGAFFQGGSVYNPEEGWILIEFWKHSGIEKFMTYVNKNAPK